MAQKGYLGVIPARYGSTRFEGKPLIDINGKSMIQRVYEQSTKSKLLEKVVVATDDERIFAHVKAFGGEVIMTKSSHPSGTDRIAEVVRSLKKKAYTAKVIVNIQGDEPLINPRDIDKLAKLFMDNDGAQIATLVTPSNDLKELKSEHVVKALIDKTGKAIYFSRWSIPYFKNAKDNINPEKIRYFKHKGIYAYTQDTLLRISQLKPCDLEKAESLEQLRWIYNGFSIQTAISLNDSIGVDTPDDLKKILKLLKNSSDK
jgi:3-deoxy-manno-octulosonate cytidylyltransferase (CMP-KDO synthetase)